MSDLDLERLVSDLTPEKPCGENLEYDAAFAQMELAAKGKPEQQMGNAVIPAEDPDWREVRRLAIELFGRTRDLRVAVPLVRAQLGLSGTPGVAEGIALVRQLIERQWGAVHPQLDPSDGNDPLMRINAVADLASREGLVRSLRLTPLASSRVVGRFNLRDVEIATGAAPAPAGDGPVPDEASVNAAFLDCDGAELQSTADGITRSLEELGGLERAFTQQLGGGSGPDLSALKQTLQSMDKVVRSHLARRGMGEAPAEEGGGGGAVAAARAPGEIGSREDVIRALDRICDWYSRNEPSSPLPLLLQRAKRLVSKSFVEIIRDIAPGGSTEVETLGGLDRSE